MKKLNQTGFSAVEGLLLVVILAIIGGTGFYIYHTSNKSGDVINEASSASQSAASGVIIKNSDRTAIIAAVKAYKVTPASAPTGATQPDVVKISQVIGSNAKGTFGFSNGGGGGTFIANKSNGNWSVIFEGQQLPGKDLGTKYNLPKSWYSSQY